MNERDSNKQTPLLLAVFENLARNHNWIIRISDLLLRRWADTEVKDHDRRTPLVFAVAYRNTRLANLLLEKGTDVEGTDNNGRTPLICTATNGSVDLAKLLLSYKADVRVCNHGGPYCPPLCC